jgi:hypothetical protein
MDDSGRLLRHFLAVLDYRTQKALRNAPADFGSFCAMAGVRTPSELVRHMTAVLGYARACFGGGDYRPQPLTSLQDEARRLSGVLRDLSHYLRIGAPLREDMTEERLLQGPFSDAMTHAGQLAMLRRFAGSPIAPESFIDAEIDAD